MHFAVNSRFPRPSRDGEVPLVPHGNTLVFHLQTQLLVNEHRAGAGSGRSVVAEDISDVIEQTGDRE